VAGWSVRDPKQAWRPAGDDTSTIRRMSKRGGRFPFTVTLILQPLPPPSASVRRNRTLGAIVKKLLLAGVSFAALIAGPAMAADMGAPVYRRPVYVPVASWTGFYVGANVGDNWFQNNSVTTLSAPVADFAVGPPSWAANAAAGASGNVPVGNNGNFIGGFQAGYNWQFAPAYVAGIEADIQWTNRNGNTGSLATAVGPFPFAGSAEVLTTQITSSKQLDYLGTVRGRFGFLATPTLLLYATGGLAYGQVQVHTIIAQSNNDCVFFPGDCLQPAAGATGSFTQTRAGRTVGGGLEWMFLQNLSAKVEYLYYDLGSVTVPNSALVTTNGTFAGAGGPAVIASLSSTRFTGNIVRFGLNYKFGYAAAPAVYK
jgi:outer membrane immunogenic protein